MKKGSIIEKLQMQERELKVPEQNFAGEKKKIVDIQTDESVKTISDTSTQQQFSTSVNQSTSNPVNQAMKIVYPPYSPYFRRLRMSIR